MPTTLAKANKNLMQQLLYGGASTFNHTASQQAFVANTYSLLAFLSLTLIGLQHILFGQNELLGRLEIVGGLAVVFNMLALRLTSNIPLARNNLLLIMLGMLMVMLITGGLAGSGIFWFFVFPVSAFFLAGRRGGLLWMLILFAAVLAMLLLSHAGLIPLAYPPILIRQLLVSLLVVSVGIYAYQQGREALTAETVLSKEVSEAEKIKSETIIENIEEGVIATDNAGVTVAINKPAEVMLGWQKSEMIGKKFVDVVPMLDRNRRIIEPQDRPMQLSLNKPNVVNHARVTYVRKNGEPFPVAITTRAVTVNGELRGVIGTFRDISEEQAIERAKTEFVTLASHQLRTPISAIKWSSELLLSGDVGTLTPQQRDYMQQVYNSNLRLNAMVDAMLLASNLELGNLTVRPEPTDLARLTKLLLIDLVHMQPTNKHLKLSETYGPDLPTLKLDPTLTKTILRNVLGNAIKYTPNGGHVAVGIGLDKIKLSPASRGSVKITVADTGYGIPLKQQKNIFVKLFRAANIKEKDTDGTGLGLYVTKALLEQVGGHISFTSKEGKGSNFTILLPIEGMSAKTPPAPSSRIKMGEHDA